VLRVIDVHFEHSDGLAKVLAYDTFDAIRPDLLARPHRRYRHYGVSVVRYRIEIGFKSTIEGDDIATKLVFKPQANDCATVQRYVVDIKQKASKPH
jgi:hypothetical protein